MSCFACSTSADAQNKATYHWVQERRLLLKSSLLLCSFSLNYRSDWAQQCNTLASSATAPRPCCALTYKALHGYLFSVCRAEFWRVC
jgi:hypothetical protein